MLAVGAEREAVKPAAMTFKREQFFSRGGVEELGGSIVAG